MTGLWLFVLTLQLPPPEDWVGWGGQISSVKLGSSCMSLVLVTKQPHQNVPFGSKLQQCPIIYRLQMSGTQYHYRGHYRVCLSRRIFFFLQKKNSSVHGKKQYKSKSDGQGLAVSLTSLKSVYGYPIKTNTVSPLKCYLFPSRPQDCFGRSSEGSIIDQVTE